MPKFQVTFIEYKPDGVGLGCWGFLNISDEMMERLSWEQMKEACNVELSGLLVDMLKEMYPSDENNIAKVIHKWRDEVHEAGIEPNCPCCFKMKNEIS